MLLLFLFYEQLERTRQRAGPLACAVFVSRIEGKYVYSFT